jgi:hypothetical protein
MASARSHSHLRFAAITLGLGALLLAMLNAGAYSAGVSLDVTQSRRFSVNSGTLAVLASLKRTVNAELYISSERPLELATLEREAVAKLSAIANKAGPERFSFIPATDTHIISDTGASEGDLARLGILPRSIPTAAGTVRFFAALRLTYADAPKPDIIQIESPDRLEYDIVSRAVRYKRLHAAPPTPEATLAAIPGTVKIWYVYGQPAGAGVRADELPPDKQSLLTGVNDLFATIRGLNPRIECLLDNDPTSINRPKLAKNGIFSRFVIAADGLRTRPTGDYADLDGAFRDLAQTAWDLTQPPSKVGVFYSSPTPTDRPELTTPERLHIYRQASPEQRLEWLLNQLGYDVQPIRIDDAFDDLPDCAALVIPRPSALNDFQTYHLRAYLASGGQVLLFHGLWHEPLLDNGLSFNLQRTSDANLWDVGERLSSLACRRVDGTLEPLLTKLGVTSADGILTAPVSQLATRVAGPSRRSGQEHQARPTVFPAPSGLTPFAVSDPSADPAADGVTALPLRACSPLLLDEQLLAKNGLTATVLLRAPADATLVQLPRDKPTVNLNYAVNPGSLPETLVPPVINDNAPAPASLPAGGHAVAVSLTGQFPFDPNEAPPQSSADPKAPRLSAPGQKFTALPGKLTVVASPDVAEYLDSVSTDIIGRPGGAPLVGDQYRSGESSLRRLLANTLDGFLYGRELVDLRRSMLPAPARVLPWTVQQRNFWTALNLAAAPVLVALLWALRAWITRRRKPLG